MALVIPNLSLFGHIAAVVSHDYCVRKWLLVGDQLMLQHSQMSVEFTSLPHIFFRFIGLNQKLAQEMSCTRYSTETTEVLHTFRPNT